MKNKKSLVAIVAILAIAAIGGTFAYFRYTEVFNNDFKLAASTVTYTETFQSPSAWTPCTQTPKTLVVTNTSTTAINARVKINTERWEKLDAQGNVIANQTLPLKANNQSMAIINLANTSSWVLKNDGYYYYQGDIAANGGVSNSFINSVTFNCDADSEYSSARYHLVLTIETIEANATARQAASWNY